MANSVFLTGPNSPGGFVTGNITMGPGARILLDDGTAASPSLAFTNELDLGFYRRTSGRMDFCDGNIPVIDFGNVGVTVINTGQYAWSSGVDVTVAQDLFLLRDAANILAQRNAANAQRLNVYNTYTAANNNEAFSVDWQTNTNLAIVGTRTAATGAARNAFFASQASNGANGYGGVTVSTAAPFVRLGLFLQDGATIISSAATGSLIQLSEFTNTATSGTVQAVAVRPTYNQSGSTAANTDLLISRVKTSVGSGAQLFLDCQVSSSSKFAILDTGVVSQYNGIATQGIGLAAVVKVGRATAQTAAVNPIVTFTPATDGTFEVSCNVLVTTATTHSFGVRVDYTDEGNTARQVLLDFAIPGGTYPGGAAAIVNTNGAIPYLGTVRHIRAKAGVAISLLTVGTFTTVTYNAEAAIRQIA